MIRVERGHGVTITVTVLDGEDPVAADTAPLVTITDWAGEPITEDPLESTQSTLNDEPIVGQYEISFPAQTELGLFQATWAVLVAGQARPVRQTIEVAGGFYFTLAALRARPGLTGMVDRYPPASLVAARTWAETKIDTNVRTSFVERFNVATRRLRPRWFDAQHVISIGDHYARRLVGVTIDGTSIDLADLTLLPGGLIANVNDWPYDGLNVTIAYVAGWSDYPPEDITTAGIAAARYHLLTNLGESGIPDRTRQITTNEGTQVLSVAGEYSPVGLPDVDVVINRYRDNLYIPGLA